jgi:hypothetical protein
MDNLLRNLFNNSIKQENNYPTNETPLEFAKRMLSDFQRLEDFETANFWQNEVNNLVRLGD